MWNWLAATVDRPLRRQRVRRERDALDEAALRDLGLSRSEIGSFDAEANGSAPCTRRRCAVAAPASELNWTPLFGRSAAASPNPESPR